MTREHGAWAFLVVPWAAGLAPPGGSLAQLVLLVATVAGYLAANAATPWLRGRGGPGAPTMVYGLLCAASTAVLLVDDPGLIRYGVLLLPLLGVVAWQTRRGRARSLVSGIASMTAAAATSVICYDLGGGAPSAQTAWVLFAGCWLFFVGSLLHVKSLIRERGDARFRRLSHGYALVALPAALAVDPWLVPAFAVAAVRAWLPVLRTVRTPIVGAVEAGCSLLLLGCLALAVS